MYFLEEMKRAFGSKIMLLGIVLSFVFFSLDYYPRLPFSNTLDDALLIIWGEAYGSYLPQIFFMVLPCLPFVASYIGDKNSHITPYIYMRSSPKQYKWIKILVNGLAGGFTLFVGAFLSFALLFVFYLNGRLIFIDFSTKEYSSFAGIYDLYMGLGISNPWVMVGCVLLLLFLLGFAIATFALGISVYLKNIYLSIFTPLILYLVAILTLGKLYPFFSLEYLLVYYADIFPMSLKLLYVCVLCGVGMLAFLVGGDEIE